MTESQTLEKTEKKYDWKFRLLLALVPRFFFVFSHALYRTCRIEVHGKEREDEFLRQGINPLYVSWHQGLLYFAYHFRNRDGIVMVSQSKDGELIARTLKLLGFRSARGSSTRGGKDALNTMVDLVNEIHCSAGLVADGPRGPFGVAKIGIIKIAKDTGLPLVPVMVWAKRKILFKSWDRTLLPLPFTRICFFYGEPLWVSAEATSEQMEHARIELTDRLNEMHQKARAYFGDE